MTHTSAAGPGHGVNLSLLDEALKGSLVDSRDGPLLGRQLVRLEADPPRVRARATAAPRSTERVG
jgi:hypothetical protein